MTFIKPSLHNLLSSANQQFSCIASGKFNLSFVKAEFPGHNAREHEDEDSRITDIGEEIAVTPSRGAAFISCLRREKIAYSYCGCDRYHLGSICKRPVHQRVSAALIMHPYVIR